mmetsp:Transcript_16604/g.31385  ORF Transcript_16604/g.31385 Transcript_16604/m.31385 type:complete len:615 (-) Transcript_16604:141-1985(-)
MGDSPQRSRSARRTISEQDHCWVKVKNGQAAIMISLKDIDEPRNVFNLIKWVKANKNSLMTVDLDDLQLFQRENANKALQPDAMVKEAVNISANTAQNPFFLSFPDVSLVATPSQATAKLPFIEWLKDATLTTEEGVEVGSLQVLQSSSYNVIDDVDALPWKSAIIVQRPCYLKVCQYLRNWERTKHKRLVVSGTPGIGKTTLIYFLLWKFFQRDLDYDTVVLGDTSRLISIQRDGTCQNHQTGDLPMLPKSLGLFDIAPTGTVKDGEKSLNNQHANTYFRVYHMLVVATPGFDRVLKEFQKGNLHELYLPVWGANATRALCKLNSLSDDEIEVRAKRCGWCIPRLNLHYSVEGLEKLTAKFCDASFGVITDGGQKTTAKDAHTMLILESSEDMKEDADLSFVRFHDDEEGAEGKKAGFVSEHVQSELFTRMGKKGEELSHLLQWIPEVGRYYFQHRVLNELVTAGLELNYKNDGSAPLKLRFDRMETFTHQKTRAYHGVLYRHPPQADRMKSVDGFGWSGDTLYLLQPTIGQEHYEIVASHLKAILQIPLPDGINKVVGLYIRPCHQGSFYLRRRQNEEGIKTQFATKPYSKEVVAVPGLTQSFSKQLQRVCC